MDEKTKGGINSAFTTEFGRLPMIKIGIAFHVFAFATGREMIVLLWQ